jgi:hypothetical protein
MSHILVQLMMRMRNREKLLCRKESKRLEEGSRQLERGLKSLDRPSSIVLSKKVMMTIMMVMKMTIMKV